MRAAIRSAHLLLAASVITCAVGDPGPPSISGAGGAGGSGGASTSASSSSMGGSTPPVGVGGGGGAPAELPKSCTVRAGELDALPWCDEPSAPADGIEFVKKWQYHVTAPDFVTILNAPLVGNLNDDNGDGVIDLCDTPDVLVQTSRDVGTQVFGSLIIKLLVLSGKDGSLQWTIDPGGLTIASPAIADLDNDGVPEILVTNTAGHVMALSPSGAVLWEGTAEVFDPIGWYQVDPDPPLENKLRARYVANSAVSVADLEGDGSPEILVGMSVLDAHGNLRFQDPTQGAEFGPIVPYLASRPVAADLDGDGTMEVLFGHVAYRADGSELFRLPITTGWSHVGDFFGDGRFEVLVISTEGLTLVSSTGEQLWGPVPPDEEPPSVPWDWIHPAAIVDIDGDGLPEALVNTNERRMVLRIDTSGPVVLRSEPIPQYGWDLPNSAGSTAFDFRGAGPDWLAYHALGLTLFDGMAPAPLDELMVTSANGPVFPVVADIDNDGSADVLLHRSGCKYCVPTDIIAYEDVQHRPSPARRIWNQWNYVASAFREDAKLAPAAPPSSKTTFRVQSRLACRPPEDPGPPH